MDEQGILEKLIPNDSLFNYIHVINQKFDITFAFRNHYGIFIEYQDTFELRNEFINTLEDTITDWVYSQKKYEKLYDKALKSGKSRNESAAYIIRRAKEKFRANRSTDRLLIQGQLGELLLFHCIQRFFKAVPLLRKMPITTNNKLERFGADAIHYKVENGKNVFILGEAKTYSSEKSFNKAFANAIDSILTTYKNHRAEIESYVHEDFLDDELNEIAEQYIDNTLDQVEVHLVSIIIYNEDQDVDLTNEEDIQDQIEKIIKSRFENYDNSKIDLKTNRILSRITYIVFPVWKLKELAEEFQKRL